MSESQNARSRIKQRMLKRINQIAERTAAEKGIDIDEALRRTVEAFVAQWPDMAVYVTGLRLPP